MPRFADRIGWAVAGAACLAFVAVAAGLAGAGPLDPTNPPGPTMKTLDEVEPRTPISALPFTINESGSYYVTGDLVGASFQDGITVVGENVTIDLNGFTLIAGTGGVYGIKLSPGARVLNVHDGTLRGWSGYGIIAGGARDSTFENIALISNGSGIVVGGDTSTSTNNILRNCTASSSLQGAGVSFYGSGIIEGCTASDNDDYGFYVGGPNVVFRDNNAVGNGLAGAFVSGTGHRVEGNHFVGNNTSDTPDDAGGLVVWATDSIVVSNSATGNLVADFDVGGQNTVGAIQGPAQPTTAWANLVY